MPCRSREERRELVRIGGASLVALRGVRVVDGSGGPPIENATVVLEGERVRDVGPSIHALQPVLAPGKLADF